MPARDDETRAVPLAKASADAVMTVWMTVDAFGAECLFGFAAKHPSTGGLSWVLSTPVVQFTEAADRARTASGRVYVLRRQISVREVDEEGRVALSLMLGNDREQYPRHDDDVAWIVARKMARHLRMASPPRADPAAVEQFIESNRAAYIRILRGWSGR
jgi:hypothetical protein